MSEKQVNLMEYLRRLQMTKEQPADLTLLIFSVAQTCKQIAAAVSRGALAGVLGSAGSENVQGEEQKKLDIISNELMIDGTAWPGALAGMASEEMEEIIPINSEYAMGDYLLLFDPLDGSSNIDVNVSIGTIFSVLKRTGRGAIKEEEFLQNGHQQVAAGYCIYGPQIIFVLTLGKGVCMFTLDWTTGEFILTRENVRIAEDTKEFAINMSNHRHWDAPVHRYIKECLQGEEGPRGKNFNMRWIASMVAEVHRILMRGGIFMYPWDNREPQKAGKLRLMYEANPMSFLIEQAGGFATNGHANIMDIAPQKLHERVSVILGAKNEVDRVTRYYQEAGEK